MQLAAAIVVFTASLPHAEVGDSIRPLHVKHQVLYEIHLVSRKYQLQQHNFDINTLCIQHILLLAHRLHNYGHVFFPEWSKIARTDKNRLF